MTSKKIFGLAALLMLGNGCAQLAFQKSDEPKIYSSETIPAEYGFREISRDNPINEKDYPKIRGDTLFIVGSSHVYSTERDAREDAEFDGRRKIMDLYGKDGKIQIMGSYASKTEIDQVEKDGKIGYAARCLIEAPLSGIKK